MGRGNRVRLTEDAIDAMRNKKSRRDERVDWYTAREGQTLIYVCPPVHESYPDVCVSTEQCFDIGPERKPFTGVPGLGECEPLLNVLKRRNMDFESVDEGWERLVELVMTKGTERQEPQDRNIYHILEVGFKSGKKQKEFTRPEPKVFRYGASFKVHNIIQDAIYEDGDITDPDAPVLIKIKRTGTGKSTSYDGTAVYIPSVKEAMPLDDEQWEAVERAIKPGGAGDFFEVLPMMLIKDPSHAEAVFYGEEEKEEKEELSKRDRKVKIKPASRRRQRTEEEAPEEPAEEKAEREPEVVEEKPKPRKRRSSKKSHDGDEMASQKAEVSDQAADLDAALAKRAGASRRRKKS